MPTRVNNSIVDDTVSTPDNNLSGSLHNLSWTSFVDALPDCISVHSASGKILWANSKLCDLTCKPNSELKSLSCCEVLSNVAVECRHSEVLDTGMPVHLSDAIKMSGRTLSIGLEPLFDEQARTCGFLTVWRDVTAERSARRKLESAERFATLGQLLSGVAHDVGTPLNVISGYAEFLLMRTKPEGPGYKELSAILDQTRRISSVFGQAMDLARPPHGRIDAIEIRALVKESLDLVGHHLRRADVRAKLTCTITPPLIYGESSQLKQAFFNLFLNAAQLVGTGGSLHVVIDEAPEIPGFLGLTLLGAVAKGVVCDFTGSLGFLMAHPEGETGGIGLCLARKILDEAGAKIDSTATGKEGGGLTIYFPLRP